MIRTTLLWLCTGSCLFAATPQPVVEFLFGNRLRNSGTLGGSGEFAPAPPGEEIHFGAGHRGLGLDTRAARRGGGGDREPAGGAVLFPGEQLPPMESLTIGVWFRPEPGNAPARLLYLSNRLDLYLGGTTIGFTVRHGEGPRDYPVRTTADQGPVVLNVWNYLAIVHDGQQHTITCYHGTDTSPLREVMVWRDIPDPAPAQGPLSIGNLDGIRPFRGLLDSVRLYAEALTAEQLQERFATDQNRPRDLFAARAVHPAPPPLFERGDVLLSSRSKHANSIETIRAFQPNRIVWSYAHDKAFIAACREAGIETFQGTINSIPGTTNTEAQVLDFDGQPVVAPWMVAFNPKSPWYWGCHNRSAFLQSCLDRAQTGLDAGIDLIQFDDWLLTVHAGSWSASCYCPECTAGFRDYLRARLSPEQCQQLGIADLATFDYREYLRQHDQVVDAADYRQRRTALPLQAELADFQRVSLRAFFVRLRQQLDELRGSRLPLSINSSFSRPSQKANCTADLVDFLQGETWHMGLNDLAIAARTAEALGKWQLFVPKPLDLRVARQGVAASYALGQLMLIPWDMYMGSDATGIRPRYYGTPEQYGDLFTFVRTNRSLFDGFANAPVVGVIVDLDHDDDNALRQACSRLFAAQVPFTFLPVGHSYYDQPLRPEALAPFRYLVTLGDQLAESDRAVLEAAQEEAVTVPVAGMKAEDLAELAPVRVWGPDGIVALPRVTEERLVIHVLDRVDRPETTPLKWISVLVQDRALGDRKLTGVTWHAPGMQAQPLDCERLAEGTRILIPELGIWGIAEIAFE